MKILALNGGGMRGFVTALLLAKAENHLGEPLVKKFALVSGVSTGAIIGGAMASGMSCTQIASFYRSLHPRVFGSKRGWIKWLFNTRYDINNLASVLQENIKQTLSQSETDFMLYAYRISGKQCGLKFWKSWRDDDRQLRFHSVITASCAAPTYFQPVQIGEDYYLDGGISVNNPSMCALAEMVRRGASLNDISLLHIGWTPPDGLKEPAKFTGLISTVPSLPSLMIDATDDAVGYQGRQLLGDRYITIGSRPDGTADVDIDSNDWPRMTEYAARLWEQHGDRIISFLKA